MTLNVSIQHRQGSFDLDMSFAANGAVTAVFGKSGSGKTSLVNAIAGVSRPDRGKIAAGGEILVDTSRHIFVPSHRRRIGYVFQDGRLFPHLTVRQNLLFGLWFARPPAAASVSISQVVEMLGLTALLDRRPVALSGGEKQRVAIGRALLSAPRLLLMDEPLASLDEARKQEILPYIERLRDRARVPIVYVSHSVSEVVRLADTVVIVDNGKVVASGGTVDLMQRLDLIPAAWGGQAGAVIKCVVREHDTYHGLSTLTSRAGLWRVPLVNAPVGTALRLRIPVREVILSRSEPGHLSALNILRGTVAGIASVSEGVTDVSVDCNGEVLVARITRYSQEKLRLEPGTMVFAIVKSVAFEQAHEGV